MYTHAQIRTHTNTYSVCTHTYAHTYSVCTHTYTQTYSVCTHTYAHILCMHTHVRTHILCMHTHVHIHTVCMHIHVRTHILCMHTHVCTHIHITAFIQDEMIYGCIAEILKVHSDSPRGMTIVASLLCVWHAYLPYAITSLALDWYLMGTDEIDHSHT